MLRLLLLAVITFGTIGLGARAQPAAQKSGVIEFSDTSPDPTQEEIKRAKSYEARASELANSVQRLATVTAVTQTIGDAFGEPSGDASGDIPRVADEWKTSWRALVPAVAAGQPSEFNGENVGSYVKNAIVLAALIKSTPVAQRPATLKVEVATALDHQSLLIDQMIAEHGQLNRALRYYPLSSIAHQAPLTCDQIARNSRDFRCFSKAAANALPAGDWCDVTDHAQSFSVDDWSSGVLMMVRTASFTDHNLTGGLKGQLIDAAHSAGTLWPKC